MRTGILVLLCGSFASAIEPLNIGQKLDRVELRDSSGKTTSFPLTGKVTAIIFYSTQCPISNEYNQRMNLLFKEYVAKGVQFVFVNANQNESWNEMLSHAQSAEFSFPVYKDAENVLADRFGATVTPEAFVFDSGGSLRYHGHIDDARNAARVQVHGLRNALDQVIAGQAVTKPESKAFGCTIKKVRKAS